MVAPTREAAFMPIWRINMRHTKAAIFFSVWIGCASLVTFGSAADLASCAGQYGNLMVSHWMTASSLQQIERLLYYQGELTKQAVLAARFKEQHDAVEKTQRELDQAARVYAKLFKAQSKDGIQKLNDALEKTALALSRNEQQANQLFLEAGQTLLGPSFRTSPVETETIEPTGDMRTLVDEKFHPRRILFGSTGQAGDNRILP